MTADERFQALAQEMGHRFDGELQVGGHYTPVVHDGHQLFVSGQIPRVGNEVLYVGAVGDALDLAQARQAAAVCAMRALAFLQRAAGSLDAIGSILRITVHVRSAPTSPSKARWPMVPPTRLCVCWASVACSSSPCSPSHPSWRRATILTLRAPPKLRSGKPPCERMG